MTYPIKFLFPLFFILISCSTTEQPAVQQNTEQIPVSGAAAHWVDAGHLIWEPGTEGFSYALYYSDQAEIEVYDTEVTGGTLF
jgi:hypothetical protein